MPPDMPPDDDAALDVNTVGAAAPTEIVQKRRGNPLWTKGISGNPAGRSRGLERRVRELLEDDVDALVLAMRDIALSPGYKASDRIAAFLAITNRGWGQARQNVELVADVTASNLSANFGALSIEEARKLEAMMSKLLESGAREPEDPLPVEVAALARLSK